MLLKGQVCVCFLVNEDSERISFSSTKQDGRAASDYTLMKLDHLLSSFMLCVTLDRELLHRNDLKRVEIVTDGAAAVSSARFVTHLLSSCTLQNTNFEENKMTFVSGRIVYI